MKNWLKDLVEEARFLIGDSAEDNPEYARAMLELIASALPFDGDQAKYVAGAMLDLNHDEREEKMRVAQRDIVGIVKNRALDVEGYGGMWSKSTPNGLRRGGYNLGYLPDRLRKIVERAIQIDRAQRSYEVTINYPLTGKSEPIYVSPEPGETITQAVVRAGDATDEWILEEVKPLT